MDSNTITIGIAVIALILSSINIWYTFWQNKRRIEVSLEFDYSSIVHVKDPTFVEINLSAFNSGFRSVPITNYEFFVNEKVLTFEDCYEYFKKSPITFKTSKKEKKLPFVLEEGELVVVQINPYELNFILEKQKYADDVMISGMFKSAQKEYSSKPIKFTVGNPLNIKKSSNNKV